jgi:hypothetical protein
MPMANSSVQMLGLLMVLLLGPGSAAPTDELLGALWVWPWALE